MPKNAAQPRPPLALEPPATEVEVVRELTEHQRPIIARAVQEFSAAEAALAAAQRDLQRCGQQLGALLGLIEPAMLEEPSTLDFDFATLRFIRKPAAKK